MPMQRKFRKAADLWYLVDAMTVMQPKMRRRVAKDALRVGLCGIGRAGLNMARDHLASSPQFKIVAGFDILQDRAVQLASLCGCEVHTSFQQLLADPRIELVIIATRSNEHLPMTLEALRAGKDVLVEKPMALDVAGADAMIAAAKKLGRRLFVRHNRRFDVPFQTALEVLKSGKIGKLFSVQLRQGGYQHRADWQTLKKFGGGQLLNWGPHLIDWALQLVGPKAIDVWTDLKRIAAGGDAEDHVKLMIRGQGGIVADIEISGGAAITQPPWLLLGDRGAFMIDSHHQCHLRYFEARKVRRLKASDVTPQGRSDPLAGLRRDIPWVEETWTITPAKSATFWVELFKSIRRGTPFPVTLAEARETMRVISMAKKQTGF
jgi:predicted dehydrogenase